MKFRNYREEIIELLKKIAVAIPATWVLLLMLFI